MSNYKKYSELGDTGSTSSKKSNSQSSNDNNLVINIESEEHKKKLVLNNKIVIVDVYGDWCQPCKAIAPRIANLAEKYQPQGFIFAKEDVDKKISQNVRGVPTLQYFFNGKMVNTTTGADFTEIKEKVENLLEMKMKGL